MGRTTDPLTIWIEDVDDDPQWAAKPENLRGFHDLSPRPYRRVPIPHRLKPPAGSVWLGPRCGDEAPDGREWCQDEVWERCSECGAEPVPYAPIRVDKPPERWRLGNG